MNPNSAILIGGAYIFTGIVIPIVIPTIFVIVVCIGICKICKIHKQNKKQYKEAHHSVKKMSEKVERLKNFGIGATQFTS